MVSLRSNSRLSMPAAWSSETSVEIGGFVRHAIGRMMLLRRTSAPVDDTGT